MAKFKQFKRISYPQTLSTISKRCGTRSLRSAWLNAVITKKNVRRLYVKIPQGGHDLIVWFNLGVVHEMFKFLTQDQPVRYLRPKEKQLLWQSLENRGRWIKDNRRNYNGKKK